MTLVLGALAGTEAVDGTPTAALGTLAALAGSAWAARSRGTARGGARVHLALGLAVLLVCAARTPSRCPACAPAGGDPACDSPAQGGPWIGRWEPEGTGSAGTLRPPRGWGGPWAPHRCRPPWRLAPRVDAPARGAWVAVLPGGTPLPPPRGPLAGPAARAGTPDGRLAVHPDALVRADLAPGPARGAGARVRALAERRADALESEGPGRGLVRALLLGDRSRLAPELLDLFTRTGARHVLALSGLHVGLVAGVLLLPLTARVRRLPLGVGARGRARARRATLLVRLALLAAYALLVGGAPPVRRAALALGLVLAALHLRRRPDPLAILAAALVAELAWAPRTLRDPSLQLSYLATLGILLGTGGLRRWLGHGACGTSAPTPGPTLAPGTIGGAFGGWARALGGRLAGPARTCLAASAAAVLATLPVAAARFGELAPAGILVAPLLLPLLAGIVGSAGLGLLLPTALAGPLLGPLVGAQVEAMVGLLGAVDALPWTPLPLPPRPPIVWGTLAALVLALAQGRHPLAPRTRGRLRRAACLLAGVLLLPWAATPAGLELHVLDVGHGTAAVLRAPGLPALVYDAGSKRRTGLYREALAPLLAAWEVRRPWIALSHDHRDHTSGLARLVERYPPRVWLGALPAPLGERLPHDLVHHDPGVGRIELAAGPGDRATRLALLRGRAQETNEGSRSLEVAWGGRRLLLTGDAEQEGLERMLEHGWLRGPLRLLLAPHHGSHVRALSALLASTRPEEVWISGSARRPPLAAELERRGLLWRGTARDGPLALELRQWSCERAADRSAPDPARAPASSGTHGDHRISAALE